MQDKYLVIHPSGDLSWMEAELDHFLDRCYETIGCSFVEQVWTNVRNMVIWVDEVGKLKNPPQPHNELASRLYAGYEYGDNIVGPAVVCGLHRVPPYMELDVCPPDETQLAILSLIFGKEIPDK